MKNKVNKYSNMALALFAKVPESGKVKTRLQGVLGEAGALRLHKALIEYVYRNLGDTGLCPAHLWLAGSDAAVSQNRDWLHSLCGTNVCYRQRGEDLGERMALTAQALLTQAEAVIIVGADCASVDAAYLEQALEVLSSGENLVFGPAEDGGYVLIGMRSVPEALFRDIPWGTAAVMAKTRENLRAAGLAWKELPVRWDVDRPEDLQRLIALAPQFKNILNTMS